MTYNTSCEFQNKTARFAGLLYLILAICCFFSMYVDSKLYVSGDAGATVNNILASEWLFRLSILSSLIGMISFLFLVNELYKLLKSVDNDQARLMLIIVVASVPVACLNLLNQFVPILILNSPGYLSVFETAQLDSMSMLFLDIRKNGVFIVDVFWGLWLIPLGLLVYRSGFFPRILGVLVGIGSFGYLITCLKGLLLPYNGTLTVLSSILLLVSTISEFSFVLWLLFKGVKIR